MRKSISYRLIAGLILMPLLIILLSQIITLQSAAGSFQWIFRNAAAAGFLYLFLLFLTAFLYGLIGRLWIASLAPGSIVMFFNIVSYFKTVLNGTPLMLNDLTLASQFGNVAHFAQGQLHLSFWLAASVLLFLALHGFLFYLERRTEKPPLYRKIGLITGAIFLLAFFVTPLFRGLALNITDPELSQEERVEQLGVVMSLYCAVVLAQEEGDAYNQEDIETVQDIVKDELDNEKPAEATETAPSPAEPETPTVIFLMSESFFDVTELPGVEFSVDPVATYHALEETCTSGKFLSSTYCGGTGYVEMEVLTGICSYLLKENDTLTSLPEPLYDRMPVITDVFKEYGYSASFLHSYTNALYNREVIYKAFGFDPVLFYDSFPEDAEMRGGYISDLEFSKKIISLYENKTAGQPMLLFGVSMENHQPYNGYKFSDYETLISSDSLDEKGLETLNAYVRGVKDADAALGYLVDYFSEQDEPVMLVFWGDHLPNLSTDSGNTVYSQLGYSSTNITTDWAPEELAKMLSTDYLIWSNYETDTVDDHVESCNFLGLSVLKRLGFKLTDYFDWLDENVYPEMLLYRPRLFACRNGDVYKSIPDTLSDTLLQYDVIIHDIVYGENEIFGSAAP